MSALKVLPGKKFSQHGLWQPAQEATDQGIQRTGQSWEVGCAGAGDLRAVGAVGQEGDSGGHPVRGLAARAGDALSAAWDWSGLGWQREDGNRFRCDA